MGMTVGKQEGGSDSEDADMGFQESGTCIPTAHRGPRGSGEAGSTGQLPQSLSG